MFFVSILMNFIKKMSIGNSKTKNVQNDIKGRHEDYQQKLDVRK